MAKKTVVVIDMQDYFLTKPESQDLVPGICSLLRYATRQRWGIIFVEFGGDPTTRKILESVSGYDMVDTIKKLKMDGGDKVLYCLSEHPGWSRHLVVCGVYGDQCVEKTVCGILSLSKDVQVDIIRDLVSPPYQLTEHTLVNQSDVQGVHKLLSVEMERTNDGATV